MALNLAYEAIGKSFVQQYYALFDDPTQRPNLVNMYNVELSFMTFEGTQLQGSVKIMEKLNEIEGRLIFKHIFCRAKPKGRICIYALTFQKINRIITEIDSQPMFDGGVIINVLGRLQADEDPPHAFSQIFVLKPLGASFFIQHDIFRLGIHDTA